jgi:hypothetical protein
MMLPLVLLLPLPLMSRSSAPAVDAHIFKAVVAKTVVS